MNQLVHSRDYVGRPDERSRLGCRDKIYAFKHKIKHIKNTVKYNHRQVVRIAADLYGCSFIYIRLLY